MLYLLGVVVALMIVCAQALWKSGVVAAGVSLSHPSVADLLRVVLSLKIIGGVVLYGLAAVMYIAMLAKFPYFAVQTLVVPATIIFTMIIAQLLFHEKISTINIAGVILLLAGVILTAKK